MIKELKTFIAVARAGTFAAAGEKVGLTQAAVSAQMRRLEDDLGYEVFDRTGRTAQLNASGLALLERANELLRLYANLGNADVAAAPAVLVTVGAIASAQRALLPDVLTRFHKRYKDCRTRIVPALSTQLIDAVDLGEMDMAVVIHPPLGLPGDLTWTLLSREPFRLLVPAKARGNDWANMLPAWPFIRYDRASSGGRQVDRFLRAARIEVQDLCELDELEAITRLVGNGLGVALVPETMGHKRWPASVRALSLGAKTFYREVGLLQRPPHMLSEPARALAAMVVAARGLEAES